MMRKLPFFLGNLTPGITIWQLWTRYHAIIGNERVADRAIGELRLFLKRFD